MRDEKSAEGGTLVGSGRSDRSIGRPSSLIAHPSSLIDYPVTMPDQPTWNDVLSSDMGGFTRPMTVHLPIHPLHSPDFIHVSPALHVCRRRVVLGMDAEDTETCREVA